MTNLPIRRRHELDPVRVLDCVEHKVADHPRFHEYRLAEAEKSLAAYEAADARGRRLWTRKPAPQLTQPASKEPDGSLPCGH